MRQRRAHSQQRILGALQLAPMSPQQLERCLSLHRTTITQSLNALETRRKVERTVRCARQNGSWPDVISLPTQVKSHE